MHHATLRFLFKKEWTERGRGEDVCVYRNKTCDEIRWWWRWSPLGSTEDGLGGKWQIGEERWRQRERETPLRGAQQLHRRHWKKTLDRKMRLCASLHHLLTEKLKKLESVCVFCSCFVSVCVQPLVFGVVNMLRNIFEGLFALVWWCLKCLCLTDIYHWIFFLKMVPHSFKKKHLSPHKWLQVLMMRLF